MYKLEANKTIYRVASSANQHPKSQNNVSSMFDNHTILFFNVGILTIE